MRTHLRAATVLFLLLSLITGVLYPLAITGIAGIAFPDRAGGSIIVDRDGMPIGSEFVGQEFAAGDARTAARWFWGRLSATAPTPYTALNIEKGTASAGSNLAPTNPALIQNVRARIDALASADAAAGYARPASQPIPIDLVTSSASGLDPHISPAAALYQLPRVARARGLSEGSLRALIAKHTTGRTLGVLGEPVVNVLTLNLDLQQQRP